MRHPSGVIVYWEFVKDADECQWSLVESFAIDDDGYPIGAPKSTSGGDRHEYLKWLTTEPDDDDEDGDPEPIMGRIVTLWTVESGVQLAGFNPPSWVPWLSPEFSNYLCKDGRWRRIINGAHVLWFGTSREAEKYLTIQEAAPGSPPVSHQGS